MESDWRAPDLDDPALIAAGLAAQPALIRLFALGLGRVPFLSTPGASLALLVASLNRVAEQLLFVIKVRGGVTRAEALAQAPEVDLGELDAAAQQLLISGLAQLEGRRLVLVAALDALVDTPHPCFAVQSNYLSSEELAKACRSLGLPAGTTKMQRQAALATVLGDGVAIGNVLAGLPDECTLIIGLMLAAASSLDVRFGAVSFSTYELLPEDLAATTHRYQRSAGATPLDQLCDRLLIGSDWSRTEIWLWAESLIGLAGSLFPTWRLAAEPAPRPYPPQPPRAFAVVAALVDLVAYVAAHPPEGKQSAERQPPVKVWRAAAKAVGVAGDLAVLLGELAIELGLLVPVLLPVRGRGRMAVQDCLWEAHPSRLAAFKARSTAENWAAVVNAWLAPTVRSDERSSVQRVMVLSLLDRIPAGQGVALDQLGAWAVDRHRLLDTDLVHQTLGELARLGVVDAGLAPPKAPSRGDHQAGGAAGLVTLSTAGRALGESIGRVAELLAQGSDQFIVQPDHSIIAPADLNPAVAQRLGRLADLESEGGATVWRLSALKLAREATRASAGELVGFLRQHSSVAVPAVIERFVEDCVAQSSPVLVGPAGCVITADVAAVADAARHRAAKLTVLAPGVAVSPLAPAKVMQILQAKGVVLAELGDAHTTTDLAGSAHTAGSATTTPGMREVSTWDVPHLPRGDALAPPLPLRIGAKAIAAIPAVALLVPPPAQRKKRR